MNQPSLIFQGLRLVYVVTSLYSDRINSGQWTGNYTEGDIRDTF